MIQEKRKSGQGSTLASRKGDVTERCQSPWTGTMFRLFTAPSEQPRRAPDTHAPTEAPSTVGGTASRKQMLAVVLKETLIRSGVPPSRWLVASSAASCWVNSTRFRLPWHRMH